MMGDGEVVTAELWFGWVGLRVSVFGLVWFGLVAAWGLLRVGEGNRCRVEVRVRALSVSQVGHATTLMLRLLGTGLFRSVP